MRDAAIELERLRDENATLRRELEAQTESVRFLQTVLDNTRDQMASLIELLGERESA